MPISSGFTPATAIARIRAIGFRPSSRAFSSDITSSAAAPTLIGELLPAVTDPPVGIERRRQRTPATRARCRGGCTGRSSATPCARSRRGPRSG